MNNQKINQGTTLTNTAMIVCKSGHVVMIDAKNYLWLSCFTWRAYRRQKSFYARTSIHANGKTRWVYMHRMVAKTPLGQVCHHRNRNSLCNLENNLINMSPNEHQMLHQNNTLTIKFDKQDRHCPDTRPL